MLGKTLRWLLLVMVAVTGSGLYLITVIPSGPSTHVVAEVVSRTSKSGPTGNTGVLICTLDNGRQISVDVPPVAAVQTGDQVFLNRHPRYFIGPDYSFAGQKLER